MFPADLQALGFDIKAKWIKLDKTVSESLSCILVLPSGFESTNSIKQGMRGAVTLTFVSPTL